MTEASAWLNDAEASRAALARGIKMPSWFFISIGAAIAAQIATMAAGVADPSPWTLTALAAGITVLFAVAGVQLARFRRLNGIWLNGLLSRVVLGTDALASTAYGVAAGGAIFAAFYTRWWLVISWAIIGGVAYALSGRRWFRAYRSAPAAHARGDSLAWLALVTVAALAALALLLFNH
ncbi:MAG: hypothetical protein ABI298_06370 [Acidimicrobiales bacterium]